jgi:hypothetical protein
LEAWSEYSDARRTIDVIITGNRSLRQQQEKLKMKYWTSPHLCGFEDLKYLLACIENLWPCQSLINISSLVIKKPFMSNVWSGCAPSKSRDQNIADEREAIEARLADLHQRISAFEVGQVTAIDRVVRLCPTFTRASQNVTAAAMLLDTFPAPSTIGVGEVY